MKTIKILFIEDEDLLRALFEDSIVGYGDNYVGYSFESDSSQDLKAAITYLTEKPAPSIIILDLRLPEGATKEVAEVPEKENGFTILKHIKADEKFVNTPVVIFTNLNDTETEKEAKRLGADEFMIKSKTLPSELLKVVVRMTEKVAEKK
jgi:CheY-like chemotaxis protein